ncbi:MAG TPA: allophanate hydrolase subunit 1 [Pseudonocardia sp.]|uniref:5-oxoprolinase subunit B family protein n=1 Tax=Pseudonocardia sp. TaxID=60912 RepID=UPI002ED88706
MRLLRYGASGLLIELPSSASVTAAYRKLSAARADGRLSGIVELVPAARTVLIEGRAGAGVPADLVRGLITEDVAGEPGEPAEPGDGADPDPGERPAEVVIPVHYDGADLELIARTAELSVPEVIELHTSAEYTVAFCGFSPGFGYLIGLPEPLRQARLADSRPSVPAGSVGLAGEFTGVYPRSSPGGWRLLGHTDEVMFDPKADPPARLAPGDLVRFEPVS